MLLEILLIFLSSKHGGQTGQHCRAASFDDVVKPSLPNMILEADFDITTPLCCLLHSMVEHAGSIWLICFFKELAFGLVSDETFYYF